MQYRYLDYDMAERVTGGDFSSDKRYLRNLVASATGDGTFSDGLGYAQLKMHGRRILGIARRMLRERKSSLEKVSGSGRMIQKELF